MSLNTEQLNALLAPINPARVQQTQGNSNVEAWDVRRWLVRIFGWGGWDDEILSIDCISERSVWDEKNPLKGRHSVVYRCTMRLVIKDPAGNVLAHFDDGATGDSQNQPSLGDAHDMAMKTAMSQALKRCAVNLGDQFGLSLYNKGSRQAVIGRSLAHVDTDEHDTDEQVRGGELPADPPAEQAPEPPVPAAEPAPAQEPDSGSSSPEAAVEQLRERVIAAMKLPKKDSLIEFGKINLAVSKAKLQNAPTTTPNGSPTTLGGMVDQALQIVSRPEQRPHGIHDDETEREAS
jgi:hypothetical protein